MDIADDCGGNRIGGIASRIPSAKPDEKCGEIQKRFREDQDLLALAIVDDTGQPVGLINRAELTIRLSDQFGWALHQRKPISSLMDPDPLVVDMETTITVSEHRAAELMKAKIEAESASRAKTEFLANMSHELRTPLNATIGFSGILSDRDYDDLEDQQKHEYSRDIHQSSCHLLELINDILDLSKIETGRIDPELTSVDVAEIVASCVRLQGMAAAEAGLSLKVKILDRIPNARADKRMVRQVLLNLLSNAIKFAGKGGSVVVVIDGNAADVSLVVQDNGIGMKPEDIPTALEPFGQIESGLNRRFDGSGLGLPLSQALINVQGGDFRVSSVPEQGTSVLFTLPIDASEMEEGGGEILSDVDAVA